MHTFMFIAGGLLFVTWLMNLFSSHLGAGQMALNAFIGGVLCLGLGAVIGQLQKMTPKP